MNRPKFGFKLLTAKALAVITAAMGSLVGSESQAQSQPAPQPLDDKQFDYQEFQQKILKPKLVLKLNVANPDNSLLAFHRSHSSHSSHRSHSSHSSHSSHYSGSSGSYTPSYTPSRTPTYSSPSPSYSTPTPSSSSGSSYSSGSTSTNETSSTSDYYTLGSRVLYKGCKGEDVKALQRLLVTLKYRLLVTGYFGDQTEVAVVKFQKANELEPNGRVDQQTLQAIQVQANGN